MLVNQYNISFPQLLTLEHNQSLRLAPQVHELQILSGCAWLTITGKDIILMNKEIASIPKTQYGAVISAISQEPLIVELRS
ncbi:MAG: hypothetical protein EAZ77_00985 [Nostocales cyanobacterium]|nr:MAG: hypothetical protein EAZ77_00985 [Nostocales cyanobacterium]